MSSGKEFDKLSHMTLPEITRKDFESAQKGLGLFSISAPTIIKVEGRDRIDFLHRVLTQEIRSLKTGQGTFAALLSAQGKILMAGYVLIFESHALLIANPGMNESVSSLNKLIVTDDVTVTDVSHESALFCCTGSETLHTLHIVPQILSLPTLLFFSVNLGGIFSILIIQSFGLFPHFMILVPFDKSDLFITHTKMAIPFIDHQISELLRIEHGTPLYGIDYDAQNMLPETGLETLSVSTTKGCYPGQEVVARIDTYGGLKKKLARIFFKGNTAPLPGDNLYGAHSSKEQTVIGKITSSALFPPGQNGAALAMMNEPFAQPGTKLIIKTSSLEISAEIKERFISL